MSGSRAQHSWPRIRIADEREISTIFRVGRRLKGQELSVIVRTNQVSYTRFGILVGRRLGKAVVRNRVKRRFREIVRQPELQQGSYDILILPRALTARMPLALLCEKLTSLLSRLS